LKIICLYETLDNKSKNKKSDEILTNRLFDKFENPVDVMKLIDSKNIAKTSINDIMRKSIESVIDAIATHVIDAESSFLRSKNTREIVTSIETFFKSSNLGTFEYVQKTGKNIFRIDHSSGTNGTEFFKKFFERIFEIYLKNYSFHIISDESHVCVIFR